MVRKACCSASMAMALMAAVSVRGQSVTGSTFAMQSSGSASGSAWTLGAAGDGYVGTYITLSQPTAVTFTLNASGTSSNGLAPDATISIANYNQSYSVTSATASDLPNFTTPTLPAGTYFVRTQLDNQTATQTPSLTVNSLSVSGTGVSISNSSTDALALSAATTYGQNFRSGQATVKVSGLTLATGTSVHVKLLQNAFNFAAAVYGDNSGDSQWINYNNTTGAYTQPTDPTSEPYKYQAAVLNPANGFNMIVPSNAGKWSNNEATQGTVNMSLVDGMAAFAAHNSSGLQLRMRQHNMIWATQQPTFINTDFSSKNTAAITSAVASRANYYNDGTNQALGAPRADSYTEEDVLNEAWHTQNATDNYLGTLGVSGVATAYEEAANAVKAAGANTRLYTNEYNVLQFSPATISSKGVSAGTDNYANWYRQGIQGLQNAGAPIGGVGSELYVNNTALTASTMQTAFANLSTLTAKNVDGSSNPMPLTLSEFGVSNGAAPSASVYSTDLTTALTMAYGTPQARTFGFWGGIGGPHSANSIYSLYDSNYNLTAAGQAWQTWMAQWQTNLSVTTDANNSFTFNGTYGLYDVTINGQDYLLDFEPGNTSLTLLAPEPSLMGVVGLGAIAVRRRRRLQ